MHITTPAEPFPGHADARAVRVRGLDGKTYALVANFHGESLELKIGDHPTFTLNPTSARLMTL